MRSLNSYITEKFQVSNDNIKKYEYCPETLEELKQIIREKINKEGLGTKNKPLDLNDIDTSEITKMINLFNGGSDLDNLSKNGYFDISAWDVSNVEDMTGMFAMSNFDGDISNWDVSNVENMEYMFYRANFTGKNGNISNWKINDKLNMKAMFFKCPLENNPPKWYHE